MTSVATSEAETYSPDSLNETPRDLAGDSSLSPDADTTDDGHSSLESRSDRAVPSGLGGFESDEFSGEQVAIVDEEGIHAMGELARSRGYMWIHLAAPGPQHRGRLGLYLEEAIEAELEERGALPPGIQASTGLDASLSDQLYRARLVEMRGIALGIPSLRGITNLGRALDAEDSAVLRWWIAAAESRPVRLVISRDNAMLRVYPSPVLFETLFEVAPAPVTPMPPSPQMAESSQAMELSDLPPSVHETNVLGTEVASFDESPAEEVPTEPYFRQESVPRVAEEDDHVELPDLDRALGLTAAEADVAHQMPTPARVVTSALTKKRAPSAGNSPQLALDYESSPPPLVSELEPSESLPRATRIASPPPPAEAPVSDASNPSEGQSLEDEEALESTLDSADRPPGTLQASDFDDLDEEEFLRTLKEDSERAPEVAPAPEAAAPALAPSALPTKKISRNPFIRLANPAEAFDSDEGTEEGEATALLEPHESAVSPLRDAPVDGRTLVDVPIEDKHAQTLSGAAAPDPNDPFNQLANREWKTWVKNLVAARGPKPLSVIERMFVTDYTRLREAVRRGVADKSAEEILDEWRDSFSKSYSEAFDALRVRGKRPTMVLDLPELASRLGRLQGAKRVQLLLVDGLRFDLGLMVQDRMRDKADAALTERLLLWSALPTTTAYQLELLGKGADGLKSAGEVDESPALVARGAGARVPRRVRTGALELLKLDVVEDSLRKVGPPILERMDAIASDAAAAIVEHLNKQPPRTMVVAFGDHGFALDPHKAGTTEEVLQGGSSPEEVLVPAFAWLTGAVH